MLKERLLILIPLIPAGIALVTLGGWLFAIVAVIILGLAAWEYWRLFTNGGFKPSAAILIGGCASLAILRFLFGFQYSDVALIVLVMATMTVHLVQFEQGSQTAPLDFAITLGGVLYIGWLGSYFISIRNLPDGCWWLLLSLSAIWIADGGAYTIGRRFGKHKISKRASPNKSWEGYIGGIFFAIVFSPLLAFLWQSKAASITPLKGLILGVILSLVCILGDLGESMFKRHFQVKDSSNLIPGHGGVFDRIDSWLWAIPIGYYFAQFWK
ncbi:MAG: phosphatidate cytidylyltransferase [Leptolinea sp.]